MKGLSLLISDHNNEFAKKEIVNKNLTFSTFENHLKEQDIFIITAPTPLKNNYRT